MPLASMPPRRADRAAAAASDDPYRARRSSTLCSAAADEYNLVLTCILHDRLLDRTTATQPSTLPVNLVVRESTAAPHR
jgi:hypothetical protein